MTFDQWLAEVDRILEGKVGFTSSDLPDFPSRDYYTDEMTPHEAVMQAAEDWWDIPTELLSGA